MSNIVLRVENLWKQYRLGVTGAGSLREDLNRLWAKIKGKEDTLGKIGETNDRATIQGEYVWALQDINFEVKQGEVLGIIGKNGAGKSTLLKILSKVTSPTQGKIYAKGRVASLLEVGTGFHPELTGRENIFLNGAILGMTKNDIRKKFDEIVEFSGIGKYIDTPVKRYSSGMYVRLAFAVAAHLEPEILIIDEVLAVGDAEFQKKCLGKMKDVSGEGRTILFVSHNMGAVRKLCSTGIFMEYGKIHSKGEIDEVTNIYLNKVFEVDKLREFNKFEEDSSKSFQVLNIELKNNNNLQCNTFQRTEKIIIEFLCVSRKPIPGLYAYMAVYSENGDIIWELDSLDIPPNPFDSLSQGEYKFKLVIPENTLNVGNYIVYINFGSHQYENFNVDTLGNCLKISITDHHTIRGNNRNGYIGKLVKWENLNITTKNELH